MLLYCILLIILVAIVLFVGIFVVHFLRNKRYLNALCMILFSLFCVVAVIRCDFVKSRKRVDQNWIMGQSVERVRSRYSYPDDRSKYQESIMYENEEYQFCTREIIKWNLLDGVQVENRYYAQIGDDGKRRRNEREKDTIFLYIHFSDNECIIVV